MTRFALVLAFVSSCAFATSPLKADETKAGPPAAAKPCGPSDCADLITSIIKNIPSVPGPDGKPMENFKLPDLKFLLPPSCDDAKCTMEPPRK